MRKDLEREIKRKRNAVDFEQKFWQQKIKIKMRDEERVNFEKEMYKTRTERWL